MKSGSGSGWNDVALPLSSCKRHTNPGAASAIALIGSRLATKSAVSGASIGWRRRATFSWARCHCVMRCGMLRHVTSAGFVARQDEYLEFATRELDVASPLNVICHLERARRDPSFGFDAHVVGPDSFAAIFRAIDNFWDTTDFTVLYLLNLWYGYGDALAPGTAGCDRAAAALVQVLVHGADPTRSRRPQVVLVGEPPDHLPRRRIPRRPRVPRQRRSGTTAGSAPITRDSADARIRTWLDEKVRFGFTEWHSDVYYQKDVTPLLTLVEFAPDSDLADACGDGARPGVPRRRAAPAPRQPGRHARPFVHEGQEHRGRPGNVRVREDRCSTTRPNLTSRATTRAGPCWPERGSTGFPTRSLRSRGVASHSSTPSA